MNAGVAKGIAVVGFQGDALVFGEVAEEMHVFEFIDLMGEQVLYGGGGIFVSFLVFITFTTRSSCLVLSPIT